ncbi:sensor histidine kinase [Salinigranum sp. GCM10025319]|uniref:sensor histidine kinase n=1 Tax=Salinigranum sp. GCM10025319 TaxID=3252687 RepID=UPI003605BC6B
MGTRINYSGLVIAGIGFFLTRFSVTLAVYEDPVRFYLAGVVPLSLGLGLAAVGVALTVADVEASLVRTTARWCVVGTVGMLVLVVLTLLGSTTGELPNLASVQSRTYLSNFLIGGSVGGTLTGLYASFHRRQRGELARQTHRLEVLNRLLRHEVLNAVTVIRGYAALRPDGDVRAKTVIEERADAIERTIEEVKYLTRSARTSRTLGNEVELGACLAASVEAVGQRHPDARISLTSDASDLTVRANERLEQVFVHLLDNAVVHAESTAPAVEIHVSATATSVRVSVRDEGPGLPDRQRALLETGDIGEFDDPRSGFGLNVVRFLVESYGGAIDVDVGDGDEDENEDGGTTVTVVLQRTDVADTGLGPIRAEVGVRPALPHLLVTFGAALLAGALYGVASEALGGSVAAIGVFYGIDDPVVGWYTHEFHSVVFAFAFAGLVSLAPARYRNHVPAYAAVGTAWGFVVWVVAAGVIAPVWLRLLGVPAPLPNLSTTLLVTHLLWGASLGVLTAWGYTHLAPRLARLGGRL